MRSKRIRLSTNLSLEQLEPRMLLAVDIEVNPFDREQTFLGGGAGYGLYHGHLVNGVPEAQREEVYDWLFKDLNIPIFRGFNFRGEEAGNDNADPFDLDLAGMAIRTQDTMNELYQEAIERNPEIKVMSYAAGVPPHLANADGHHDLSKPNFHEELAEWLYGNLVTTKQRYGFQIDMLDILNEPDLGKLSRSEAAQILAGTVPALQNLVDANYATYGVDMPLIVGASTLTVGCKLNSPAVTEKALVLPPPGVLEIEYRLRTVNSLRQAVD